VIELWITIKMECVQSNVTHCNYPTNICHSVSSPFKNLLGSKYEEINNFLHIIINNNVPLGYMRNISNSTRSFFEI